MAFIVSHIANYSCGGNQRCKQIHIIADGSEANIETGLAIIESFQIMGGHFGNGSLPSVVMNKDSSNVAANGKLGISGLAANDVLYINIFGR